MSSVLPAEEPVPVPGGPGIKSSEFVATMAALVANVIGMLVVMGFVASRDQTALVNSIQGIIAALALAGGNVVALWKYVSSRQELKEKALEIQALRLGMKLPKQPESSGGSE